MNNDRHLLLITAADNAERVADRIKTAAYMEDPDTELLTLVRLLGAVVRQVETAIINDP
jgi:hypothetical protein